MADGVNQTTDDAENNVLSDGTSTYVYDALNRRVRVNAPNLSTEYVYHPGGRRATTFRADGVYLTSETYLGSTPVAFYSPQSTTGNGYEWQHQDWLGTERARTDSTGAIVGAYSSLAFGDGASSTGTDWDPSHFTGLDTNPTNGVTASNSHAMFRDYNPTSATWMSPDPYLGSYDMSNPQSMNRYAYVLNNPVSLVDPSGQQCVWDDGSFDSADDPDTGSNGACTAAGGTYVSPEDWGNLGVDGDWSSSPDSWLAGFSNISATVNAPINPALSGSFSFSGMSFNTFIASLQQAGFSVSIADSFTFIHTGTNLRDSSPVCSIHVVVDPFSGQYGNPVSGEFHIDEIQPFTGPGGVPTSTLLHAGMDVIPDVLHDGFHLPITPGNQSCPNSGPQ